MSEHRLGTALQPQSWPKTPSGATSATSRNATIVHLAPFLGLARELSAMLVPVFPRPEFQADLERSLVTAARQQYAHQALAIGTPPPDIPLSPHEWMAEHLGLPQGGNDRRWMIGAAAIGSAVSVAGIIAYLRRQRGQRAA